MSTPASATADSEAHTDTELALYEDRLQAMPRSAIELWPFASTGTESRRRDELMKNEQKIVQSFFD